MNIESGDDYYPYLLRYFLRPERYPDIVANYSKLYNIISKKDAFLVCLTTDDLLYQTVPEDLKDRVVCPCGGFHALHCTSEGHRDLVSVPAEFDEQFTQWLHDELPLSELEVPCCEECHSGLIFNQVGYEEYNESEYLPAWQAYRNFLEKSMNQQTVILELGVMLNYPGVFRLPMEKLIKYQEKAKLYRVNAQLYQIPADMNQRANGIAMSAMEFLNQI